MGLSGVLGLTQTLDSLQFDDGRPDNQARREVLDEIVAHTLSNDEIRYLRGKLNAITMTKDICANLPAEILIQVAEYFELEDIITARCISRTWREIFSSSKMAIRMTQKHFRTKWEQSNVRDSITKEGLAQWFPQAAIKRVKKQRGYYHSMSAYHYCWKVLQPHVGRACYGYSSGRVAFQLGEDSIVVNTLNQGPFAQPRIYMDDNRMPLGSWILSEDFLIVQRFGPPTILAWSLENAAHHTIRLPSPVRTISASHSQVVLITVSDELLIWTIGGSLISVDMPEEQKAVRRNWDPIDILFHPLDERRVFFFYQRDYLEVENGSAAKSIIVQEFFKGQFLESHSILAYNTRLQENESYSRRLTWNDDTDGLWILKRGLKPPEDSPSDLLLSFNMYTCKFGTVPLVSVDIPSIILESVHGIPGQQLHPEQDLGHDTRPIVFIDEDFLVIMGQYGYVVYSFDKDIELPVSGSLSDESLQVPAAERCHPLEGSFP